MPATAAAAANLRDNHAVVDRRVTVPVGEQPAAVVMGSPQAANVIEKWLWQRHQPLFVTLPYDAQHLPSHSFCRPYWLALTAPRVTPRWRNSSMPAHSAT
jgi:hypothetical protein